MNLESPQMSEYHVALLHEYLAAIKAQRIGMVSKLLLV